MLKVKRYSSSRTYFRAMGHHLSYGITHSVTCQPTQVNAPNPSQKGWYNRLTYPAGMKG